jgi:subtilisin family serine protease
MHSSDHSCASGKWPSLLLATAILILPAAIATAAPDGDVVNMISPITGQTAPCIEGEVLVTLAPGADPGQVAGLIGGIGARIERVLAHGRVLLVELPQGANASVEMRRLMASPLVMAAEPNAVVVPYAQPTLPTAAPRTGPLAIPNDPLWPQQWGPAKISCPDAWDMTKGDSSVVIAIIDSGVDYNHEDLANHMWQNPGETPGNGTDDDGNGFIDDIYGWDFYDDDNDPIYGGTDPPNAHGTHVSGTASADTDNALGVAGVAWFGQIMAIRVLGPTGTTADIIAGIDYATDNGAAVMNMSLGPAVPYFTTAYQPSIDNAWNSGVTVVCAAGNSYYEITTNPATWFSPVCNDGVDPSVDNHVLGVMATDSNDTKADFSNYGNAYRLMDVCAPGVDILSTTPGDNYEGAPTWSGTSMAAPHAAGLAALLVDSMGMDAEAIIEQIRVTCTDIDALNPLYADKLGTGRIDAAAAIGLDLPPGPATAVNAFDSPGDEGGSITVTWRKSADDGAGRDDVIGYELWRGQTDDPSGGGFMMLAGLGDLPPGSSGYKDEDPALVDGMNYYYYVTTRDASNSVNSGVAGPASPRDDSSPPAVDTLVVRDTQADEGRSMTLTWVGYAAPADVTQFRIYRATADFTDVTEDGVEWVADVMDGAARNHIDQAADPTDPESEPLDLTDYWYAVTALDEADNELTAVTAVGPVQCAPNLSISFNFGLQMITIPAEPVDSSPMSVFDISDPSEMRFARYDPLTGSYHTLSTAPADPALAIVPGRGFWLDRPVPSFIGVAGHAVEDEEYEVALGQGWNMVGSAYEAAHPFAEIGVRDPFGTDESIAASNLVRNYGWRYDSFERSYKLLSPLMPGGQDRLPARESMWVYALVPDVSLVFSRDLGITAAGAVEDQKVDLGGWQLQLVARTANAADTDNFIGVSANAKDVGQILSPPPVADGIDLFLAGGSGARVAVDLKEAIGAETKWTAVVECRPADADVELSWPELGLLPADVRPVLTDLATGRSVYMRTAKAYHYRSRGAGARRRFEITVAGPDYRPVALQLAAVPNGAGGAEITYTLNRSAKVQVEVRNLAGRLVGKVAQQDGEVGLNRVVWNGMAANGVRAPAGRYIVLVTAVADDNGETVRALRPLTLAR